MLNHAELKDRQRREREHYPDNLSLRVHRALSWLARSEQCDDSDGQFIFLWIAFNAAYANETGDIRIAEAHRLQQFLERLVSLDGDARLDLLVWDHYSSSIRFLLENQYVFQPFWNHQNKLEGSDDWEAQFKKARQAAHRALANRETSTVLSIVFTRLYTLRNQLIHGGATWNSQINRDQLRDSSRLLGELVPTIIEIMMDSAQEHWGEACYPVA